MSSARNSPLAGKSFYLDIPRGKHLEFLAENVKRLGGVIESFLSKEVTCVVSSSQEAKQRKRMQKQICAALRETQTETQPCADPPKDCRSPLYKPLDTALISRGKKLLHKAIGNQDKICGNSILDSAQSWGVQVVHIDEMVTYIQRLSKKHPSKAKLGAFGFRPPKVLRLKGHFLKIEDANRQLCPFFKHFKNFPQLYFLSQKRHSPFVPPQAFSVSKERNSRGSLNGPSPLAVSCLLPKTRKGYCECCKGSFTDLHVHLQSPCHRAHVMDPSHYAHVDGIISQLTNDFVPFSSNPTPRMSPGISADVTSGVQTEAAESKAVRLPVSGQELQCYRSAEGPWDSSHLLVNSHGDSAYLLEDQGIPQLTEQCLEMLPSPVSPALQTCGPASDPHEGAQGFAETAPKATATVEVKHDALPLETGLLTEPIVLSRKRSPSCSPDRQASKRQALMSDKRQRDVGATEYLFAKLSESQAAPRHPSQTTGPLCTSGLFAVSSQLPQEGLHCLLCNSVAIDAESLKSPVQPLDHKEFPAFQPYKLWGVCQRCSFSRPPHKLRSLPGFPVGRYIAPKLLGSVVCSSSLDMPDGTQVVSSEQLDLGPGSCLPLPSNPPTHPCTEEKSSSSISEWDGPLLCVLAGASRLSSETTIDAALLGTCVSLKDSCYESHLCSVLHQTPAQN